MIVLENLLTTKLLRIGLFHLMLKAQDDIVLPPYKGSTLRGGFGTAFRKICCVNRKIGSCRQCLLKEKCSYAYVFESSPPSTSTVLKRISDIPRPFVIEPPLENKRLYHNGEFLKFTLLLFGKAIEYLPYFVFTFRELGNIGLGKGRGKYVLDKVLNASKGNIYDSKTDILDNSKSILISFDNGISLESGDTLSLQFITPTRIKIKGDLVSHPEFHILIRALLHRLSSLFYFYEGEDLALDYGTLIEEAEKIRVEKSQIRWIDWERYSSRQDTRMKLGGFVGRIIYKGDFAPFLPLLLIGQYTHIGKNCTFGLGKYEIENRVL